MSFCRVEELHRIDYLLATPLAAHADVCVHLQVADDLVAVLVQADGEPFQLAIVDA